MDLTSMPHFQSVTSHIYVVLLPSLLEVINISISLVFSCLSLNTFVMLSLIYLLIYTLFFLTSNEDILLHTMIKQLRIVGPLFCLCHISIREMLTSQGSLFKVISPLHESQWMCFWNDRQQTDLKGWTM